MHQVILLPSTPARLHWSINQPLIWSITTPLPLQLKLIYSTLIRSTTGSVLIPMHRLLILMLMVRLQSQAHSHSETESAEFRQPKIIHCLSAAVLPDKLHFQEETMQLMA